MLILTITTMILVSLCPYPSRKIFLFVVGLLYLAAISCFADSLFLTVNSTPCHQEAARMRAVLSTKAEVCPNGSSLPIMNNWAEDLSGISWGFSPDRKIPSEWESSAPAEGKATALDLTMQASGARGFRLAIGKPIASTGRSQTWPDWAPCGRTYLLDPAI